MLCVYPRTVPVLRGLRNKMLNLPTLCVILNSTSSVKGLVLHIKYNSCKSVRDHLPEGCHTFFERQLGATSKRWFRPPIFYRVGCGIHVVNTAVVLLTL